MYEQVKLSHGTEYNMEYIFRVKIFFINILRNFRKVFIQKILTRKMFHIA